MLTKIVIRNFKRFEEVSVELGNPVAFIGPNNSGKTSAMQALALWDAGVKRWHERRSGRSASGRRRGVAVNRRDLVAIPVPNARLLWRDRHVRDVLRENGEQRTQNVRIDVIVEGVSAGKSWRCGLEFDYANEESFYCRPLRTDADGQSRMEIPPESGKENIAFLPPMSGIAATETRLDIGAMNVRLGEGRTAEVLRNLCYLIHEEYHEYWHSLVAHVRSLFGVELQPPHYVQERGEITMNYKDRDVLLDLSSGGRGLQQTMLILAYMYANRGATLLLDEPDAHLEILRQRQIYRLITEVAAESGSQIIAASHSEVILNEASNKDVVVAFLGRNPHRIDDRGSQLLKALREIGFDQYYQAEQQGWVLYLEGSTDLAILQAVARKLGNADAITALERPFAHYVGNQLAAANRHYYGLREALPNLLGVAILDRDAGGSASSPIDGFQSLTWKRREIENYLCTRRTLENYIRAAVAADFPEPLLAMDETNRRLEAMASAITEVESAMRTLGRGSPWSEDAKVSDDFLTPLFHTYFNKLELPNLMNKNNFHALAEHVPEDEIDAEVSDKLNAIARTAAAATPIE